MDLARLASLAAAVAAINIPAMESPGLGSSVARATEDWGAATREERIVAHYYLFSFFRLCESAWYQRRADILDNRQWGDGRRWHASTVTAQAYTRSGGRIGGTRIHQHSTPSWPIRRRPTRSAA